MRIRQASERDFDAIARVQVATWRAAYAGIVSADYLAGMDPAQRAQRIREQHAAGVRPINVVAQDGRAGVVGFASGGPERTGHPRYGGEVYALYVLPDWQGQGLGRRLVQAVTQELHARGADGMLIWVLADNAPSRAFYQALGGRCELEKPITIGQQTLPEVAYVWDDIRALLDSGRTRRRRV